ncbi:CDP-alcohol phosphatidyltransferase [Nesidiocoris tenuis]|uniref:CDP-alcohol phosphatidyltransferase n=1 Tax=Nesidiocoris tenuis TaxID=355587 RepID=A0ABN7B6N0_9HEMI|nr:CDP-alcohol phosphatidyltransferase [Nesidiocoris tenuis]
MLFNTEKILSPGQLKRLSEHKYSCDGKSLLDQVLQPWWNFLVGRTPLWLAPNLITVIGLITNVVTTLILVCYSPDAKSDAPAWVFILCALGLFIYQSLDAIDGKQARRTNSQSPLGELFDHGCDSVSTVFVAISACIAVNLGEYPTWMFFQCFAAITLFYCAHWQAYVSGTLRFGRVDVTEAQFTIIGIHMISAMFGTGIWATKILNFELKQWEVIFGSFVGIYLLQRTLAVILTGGVGKNGSSVAGTSVLSPVIPLSLVVVPAFIIYRKSKNLLYETHPVLYILSFGLVGAKVTNRLVVAHMTRNEMDYFDSSLIGPLMLFLNQYFNFFIDEYYVLWVSLIWVTFDLIKYCSHVCLEICDHMHIMLFRIVPTAVPQGTTNKNG